MSKKGIQKPQHKQPASSIHDAFPPNVFEATEQNIQESALYLYDYINQVLGFPEHNIILFGRSIGTGPTTYIGSKRNPGSIIMMSSFKSIRDIVRDQAGMCMQYLVRNRFNNLERIDRLRSPTFFVHGLRDHLISYKHSKELKDRCKAPSMLITPQLMDHNNFDFLEDLVQPFNQFLHNHTATCETL